MSATRRAPKPSDLLFEFKNTHGSEESGRHVHTCCFCGKRYHDHWLTVFIDGYPWGTMCGNCLTSEPKHLAQLAKERAPIVRKKRPPRGCDANMNRLWADDLLRFAAILETANSLDEIPCGGLLARKIGEAYREMEGSRT